MVRIRAGKYEELVLSNSHATGLEDGRYFVSPLNFDPSTVEGFDFPDPLTIYDGTLRKIVGTPGVRVSTDNLLRVAEALEAAGVKEIYLNVCWWGDDEPDRPELELAKAVLSRDFEFSTTVFSESIVPYASSTQFDAAKGAGPRRVIDTLASIGARVVSVGVGPASPVGEASEHEGLAESFDYAQQLGLDATVTLMDVGRGDFDRLVALANTSLDHGVFRVDLMDSQSSMSPEALKVFVSRFRAALNRAVPVTMHTHDDFGLATAGAIAAASAGAHPDVSVTGISYRAGFAAFEEVVLGLELLYGVPTGISLDALAPLSAMVSEYVGLPGNTIKAVGGRNAHVRDIMPWTMPMIEANSLRVFPPPGSAYAPSLVGGEMQVVWGVHHSRVMINGKLTSMGLPATEENVTEVRRRIDEGLADLREYPHWLSDEAVSGICREVASA